MPYKDYLPAILPPWLRAQNGAASSGAYGSELDRQLDLARQAVLARFPGLAPTDALDDIGRERGLGQGPTETDAAYAERLRTAWDAWAAAGSHHALLTQLKIAGFTGVYIVQWNGRHASLDGGGNLVLGTLGSCITRTPPHAGWVFDATDTHWSKFMLIVPSAVPAAWNATTAQTAVNALVKKWKPGKAYFEGTVLISTGELWGWPVGTWGDAGTWGGVATYLNQFGTVGSWSRVAHSVTLVTS